MSKSLEEALAEAGWEENGRTVPVIGEYKIIRPKKVEKQEYALWFDADTPNSLLESGMVWRTFKLTKPQAKAISEAISQTIKFIMGESIEFVAKTEEARNLLTNGETE